MNEPLPPSAITKSAVLKSSDVFARLTYLGWNRALLAIIAGLAASCFLLGYFVVYWRNADMDFMVIYSALAMNDGKPQQFLDHTAYLTIITVKSWFRLLHDVGLLDAWTLPAVPPATDATAFELAMTHAVRAGRVLAFLIATSCVMIFAGLARLILRDWRVALLAAMAFALSGGVAVHSRILRSELVAAMPVIFALMILIVLGRRAAAPRPIGMGVAALLCVLGIENKVQAILLIGLLPLLILPFGGRASASAAFWRNTPAAWFAAGLMSAAALIAGGIAWPLVVTGFDRSLLEAAHFQPLLLHSYGVYQVALAVLICGCMIAYALIWR